MSVSRSSIIHIGLPKTATTTLQVNVLPYLCKEKNYIYNPREFLKIKEKKYFYSPEERSQLRDVINQSNVLISNESLIDWNPRRWEYAADRVLDLFGRKAKIVISVRDPYEFLKSVYIQKVQEGNIFDPEEFFISSDEYNLLEPYLTTRSMVRFDYDSLDYEKLKKLYVERFEEVYILPLSRLYSLYPFAKLFNLNEDELNYYLNLLRKSPVRNRAYSNLAMQLTLKRESMLNSLGLKSFGSEDFQNKLKNHRGKTVDTKAYRAMQFRQKYYIYLLRLISWRWWMQNIMDKIIPYKRYELPESIIPKIDKELMQKNSSFIVSHEKIIDKDKM